MFHVEQRLFHARSRCLIFGAINASFPAPIRDQHPPKIPQKNPVVFRNITCGIDAQMDAVTGGPQPYR